MLKLTRYLATRLRRLAGQAPVSQSYVAYVPNGTDASAWDRLDAFISDREIDVCRQRERELAHENARFAITLIGHNGTRVAERVAELHELGAATSIDPALLALTLAQSHGDSRTRMEALRALTRVAQVRARLTPPSVSCIKSSRNAARHWRA